MATLDEVVAMVEAGRDEVIALARDLVRINTVSTGVMPTGNETPAAEFLAAKLRADGIESTVVESAPTRGNVIAIIPGAGGTDRSFGLLGHTDVVPVEDPSLWTVDPFGGEIKEGRLWGRGSSDMKSTVAGNTMAAIFLKRAGVRLKGNLYIESGADEESGGVYGFGWLAEHRPALVTTTAAINEGGGGIPMQLADGTLVYFFSLGEKGRYEVHLNVRGKGFHASQPWRAESAIDHAYEAIQRIKSYEPTLDATDPMFQHLDRLAGVEGSVTAENVERAIAQIGEREPALASMLKALSRMTIGVSMIEAGVKSNSIAERCHVTCDIRTLPWQDADYIRGEFTHILDGLDFVDFEVRTTAVSSASPLDDPCVAAMQEATRIVLRRYGYEKFAFIPSLTVGFTDSRLVRPLGVHAYGFTPGHPAADRSKSGAHNNDESQDVESIVMFTQVAVATAWLYLGVADGA
jgi:acetylornithine deacetylase/succinyl-diaminopimelate desuccinylase-like protein